jgi:hypothetical protein
LRVKVLLVALSEVLIAVARSPVAATAQAVGTEDMVACLVGLLGQGPLDQQAFRGQQGPGYDDPVELLGAQHLTWELSGLREGAVVPKAIPRALVLRLLGALVEAGASGPAAVMQQATGSLAALLLVDLEVDSTLRSWEVSLPRGQALLHDQVRLEALQLLAKGEKRANLKCGTDAQSSSPELVRSLWTLSTVVCVPGGRSHLLEKCSSGAPAWASPAAEAWQSPTAFTKWDLAEEQPQALQGIYPYIRCGAHDHYTCFFPVTDGALYVSTCQGTSGRVVGVVRCRGPCGCR